MLTFCLLEPLEPLEPLTHATTDYRKDVELVAPPERG